MKKRIRKKILKKYMKGAIYAASKAETWELATFYEDFASALKEKIKSGDY